MLDGELIALDMLSEVSVGLTQGDRVALVSACASSVTSFVVALRSVDMVGWPLKFSAKNTVHGW